MIALQFQSIQKSYGTRLLFDDATVSIAVGEKVGLIGANGSGKTTLLRIILGQESLDSGSCVIHPDVKVGYLEQHEVIYPDETVRAYLARVSGCEPWACAKMAGAFEIKHGLLDATIDSLSGGYQMRVRLAGILVKQPDLLLLDEPTNYLDLNTVLLLEKVLQDFRGALLLVSHDREFLKNVCTHTLELENQRLTLFTGNIEAYFAEKEIRLKETVRHNRKIQAQRRHLQEFVDRFRASKATQAQSKLKQLEKLETIEIKHSLRTVRIRLPSEPQRNAVGLTCRDLSVGYAPEKPILQHVEFEINRGEHLAVLGENGQGKSTLLKNLAGDLTPLSGSFKWGHNLRVAYYAQHVPKMLPLEGTAGIYLSSVAPTALPEDLLRMAGNFLFTQDDLDKPISVLSGGERARLCLAAICLGKYDVLILDEPTNHLDFDTVEALGEALADYPGTIVFVSHSRTFVAQIATSILEIKDGRALRYPYPYEIYVHELKTHERIELAEERAPNIQGNVPYVRTKSEVWLDLQKEKRSLSRLELDMEGLTKEKHRLHRYFEDNPSTPDVAKAKRLKDLEAELLAHEGSWFETQDRIVALEQEQKTAKENA